MKKERAAFSKISIMEKRIIGLILIVLGIVALLAGAYNFIDQGDGAYRIKIIVACVSLGLIFFASGISLIRTTRDVMKDNERVS